MGWISNLWNKTIIAKWLKENTEKKRLKQELLEEMKDDIDMFKKEKLRQEILDELNGVEKTKDPNKKSFLHQLGEEFKTSGIGSQQKIDQLLGKNRVGNNVGGNTSTGFMSNDKIVNTLGGNKLRYDQASKKIVDKQGTFYNKIGAINIPDSLGKNYKLRSDYGKVIGGHSIDGNKLTDSIKLKKNDKRKLF